MKRLALAVVTAAALFVGAASVQAESGQFIYGGRLAFNYSTLMYGSSSSSYNYTAGYGGLGVEAGLVGRLALVEGQMGAHIGANFISRGVYSTSTLDTRDLAIGVPVLFEINPFSYGGLRSSIYEMIFLQIGVQADYVFSYSESINGKTVDANLHLFERENVGVGLIIGAVGYFSSYCSLDIRYYYAFTPFDKVYAKNWFPYSYNIGLSFYL